MNMRIATISDLDQVVKLLSEMANVVEEVKAAGSPGIKTTHIDKDYISLVLKKSNVLFFIAEKQNTCVGLLTLYLLPDMVNASSYAHIEDFIVLPEWRNQGIGTALLSYVIKYCDKQGISPLKVTSSLPLTRAHAFYEKNGGIFSQKVWKFPV